jgi:hypothetical protein
MNLEKKKFINSTEIYSCLKKVIRTCGKGEAINLASITKELFSIKSMTAFGR